jgi:DNA (cytosine-5)-methyltransferase 1
MVADHTGSIVGWLDILFRMFTPRELALAMSFPGDYDFSGNRSDQVRQIGNAVPVRLAQALCRCALKQLTAVGAN